jgi:hypothetical protein
MARLPSQQVTGFMANAREFPLHPLFTRSGLPLDQQTWDQVFTNTNNEKETEKKMRRRCGGRNEKEK